MARARTLRPKKPKIPGLGMGPRLPGERPRVGEPTGGITLPGITRPKAKPNKPGTPTGGDPKEGFVPPGRGATVKGGKIITPKDKAPKGKGKPPKGKPKGGTTKGGTTKTLTAQQRAEQEMQSIYGPVLGEYARLIKSRQAEAAAEAARKQAVYAAFAKYYQEHAPQQIQGIYSQAAAEQSAWGKGYSLGMQLAQQEEAASANKYINLAGGGEAQKITPGPEAGNVIYGLGGGIPASTLSQQGAAFAGAAALQSPAILSEGGRQANELLKLSAAEIEKLKFEELQVRTEMRAKVFDRVETLRAANQKSRADRLEQLQDKAEYMTDKSGVFWVVKGNRVVPTKTLTLAGKKLVLDMGEVPTKVIKGVIYERVKGRWVPVGGQPDAPDVRTASGYIWEKNPKTGVWEPVGGLGPQQKPTIFGSDASGRYMMDPVTGEITMLTPPVTGKGKNKKPRWTAMQKQTFNNRAAIWAQWVAEGDPDAVDDQGNPAPIEAPSFLKEMRNIKSEEFPPIFGIRALIERMPEMAKVIINTAIGLGLIRREKVGRGKATAAASGGANTATFASFQQSGGGSKTNWLATLWVQAGGDPNVAGTAAAIAMAESGGRVDAWNPTGQDRSAGLWQINYYGAMGPARTRQFGPPELLRRDPLANAKAAVAIYKSAGNNFRPWTTYTSGKYEKYLGGVPVGGGNQGNFASASQKTGGAWQGSLRVADKGRLIAEQYGLSATGKRSKKMTSSGGISDHWTGSKNAFAYDLSGTRNQMHKAAFALAQSLGIQWDGLSELIEDVYVGDFRIQIIYNTPKYGGHMDHIHFGVRRVKGYGGSGSYA